MTQTIEAIAGIATAIGVFFAARQLWLQERQAATQFEDALSREYRDLANHLPIEVHFGEALPDAAHRALLPVFFRYFDLTNEQVFLRIRKRVRRNTWMDWSQGISGNLAKPAFARAWDEIKTRVPDSFQELRALEESAFKTDPRQWRKGLPRPRRRATVAGESALV